MYIVWEMTKNFIHIAFCSKYLHQVQKYINDDTYLVVYCEE